MTVLITGFLPESPDVENASGTLVERLSRRPGLTWATASLTQSSSDLRTAIPLLLEEHRPSLTILTGQAPGRNKLCLELVALNLMSFRVADVDGFQPRDTPVIPETSLALRTRLPLFTTVERMRAAGFPATVSHHAGCFLCNQAYFLALHHLMQHGALHQQVLFLHIPLMPSQTVKEPAQAEKPSLPTDYVLHALEFLIAALTEPAHREGDTGGLESAGIGEGLSFEERGSLFR